MYQEGQGTNQKKDGNQMLRRRNQNERNRVHDENIFNLIWMQWNLQDKDWVRKKHLKKTNKK
jgi:hypothetical protein